MESEVEIRCGDCDAGLLKILVTRTNEELLKMGYDPVNTQIQCACGICGGSSFKTEVGGSFHVGAWDDQSHFEPVASSDDEVMLRAWRS